jgi:hypothetical protein
VKLLVGQMLDQLGKHAAAGVHPALLLLPLAAPSSVSSLDHSKSFPASNLPIPCTVNCLRQVDAIFPGQHWIAFIGSLIVTQEAQLPWLNGPIMGALPYSIEA